jgi:penicillin-binding protein 1A
MRGISGSLITAGVWVGNDDKRISLGKKETGARAALPIWLEFMQQAVEAYPAQDFQNVVPLEKEAGGHQVKVDTPDTAPPADAAEQGLTQTQALPPARTPGAPSSAVTPAAASAVVKPLDKISAPKPN